MDRVFHLDQTESWKTRWADLWSMDTATLVPGAYDTLTARLVNQSGFGALYVSGAAVSYTRLGQPDIGLVGVTEMADVIQRIASVVDFPILADGDNGYGNALNTMRAVQLFENAGANAIQLEDQSFPKRCGHLKGKKLVSSDEMIGKIRAACEARRSLDFKIIGRTDSRSQLGLAKAIERGQLYREAGADAVFIEAPQSCEELRIVAQELPNTVLICNMVEGGKTPILPLEELKELGYSIVLYPNALTRSFVYQGMEVMNYLRMNGTSKGCKRMVDFNELNTFLQLNKLAALEEKYVKE